MWKPALAEIAGALVPAFIIEVFQDGRFTVFVPAAPTPFSGSVYILPAERGIRRRAHTSDQSTLPLGFRFKRTYAAMKDQRPRDDFEICPDAAVREKESPGTIRKMRNFAEWVQHVHSSTMTG